MVSIFHYHYCLYYLQHTPVVLYWLVSLLWHVFSPFLTQLYNFILTLQLDQSLGGRSKIRKFGKNSFKITMKSPTEPDVYASMSQRIDGLMKNAKYIARFWIKAERAGKGTFEITTDDEWNDRKQIDGGEYDWREFKHIFNIGNQTSIDFRIISEEPGTVWVDGISFKRHFPDDKESG